MLHPSYFSWKLFTVIISLLLISGCTQNFQDSTATVREAYNNQQDVQVSPEQVAALPYASMLIRINDSRQLFLILGFDDINQSTGLHRLTWISADKSTIVTENGRIVYTSGFNGDNLVGLSETPTQYQATDLSDTVSKKLSKERSKKMPKELPNVADLTHWTATYDWMPGYRYQFNAQVVPYLIANETLSNDYWSKQTQHIMESVYYPTLNAAFQNNFWVEDVQKGTNTYHQVVKSIQYLGPQMAKVEMTMVKPYVIPTPAKENP